LDYLPVRGNSQHDAAPVHLHPVADDVIDSEVGADAVAPTHKVVIERQTAEPSSASPHRVNARAARLDQTVDRSMPPIYPIEDQVETFAGDHAVAHKSVDGGIEQEPTAGRMKVAETKAIDKLEFP
jgi:hypothetical protein